MRTDADEIFAAIEFIFRQHVTVHPPSFVFYNLDNRVWALLNFPFKKTRYTIAESLNALGFKSLANSVGPL